MLQGKNSQIGLKVSGRWNLGKSKKISIGLSDIVTIEKVPLVS